MCTSPSHPLIEYSPSYLRVTVEIYTPRLARAKSLPSVRSHVQPPARALTLLLRPFGYARRAISSRFELRLVVRAFRAWTTREYFLVPGITHVHFRATHFLANSRTTRKFYSPVQFSAYAPVFSYHSYRSGYAEIAKKNNEPIATILRLPNVLFYILH